MKDNRFRTSTERIMHQEMLDEDAHFLAVDRDDDNMDLLIPDNFSTSNDGIFDSEDDDMLDDKYDDLF